MTKKERNHQWYANNRQKAIRCSRIYQKKNRAKVQKYQARYRKTHKRKILRYTKFWNIQRKYGLTETEYQNLLKSQNNRCALCGNSFSSDTRTIHVDHCHKSGKVRGIVHQKCNDLLGRVKDDVEILNKAIQYLLKNT